MIKKILAGRLLRLFSTAVVDQVLLSGASFLVGFLLIRRTSDFDYGMFVLVQSAITLAVAAQAAWLGGPMAVVAPAKAPETKRLMIGAVRASQIRLLRPLAAIAIVVVALGFLLKAWSGLIAWISVTAVLAGWAALQREYSRGALLIYARPQSVLHADIYYVIVLLAGTGIAIVAPKPAVLWAAGALVLAAWCGGMVATRSLAKNPGWVEGDASVFWREMRPLGIWATAGSVIYWLFTQSYNYVLASRIDLHAVADVNAARLLLMPAIVLTVGVKTLLGPISAGWLAEHGLGPLLRRVLVFIVGMTLIDLLYFVSVWIFRNWLTADLMHKVIEDRDRLLILWACIALIGLVRDLLQTAVFALRSFQTMAWLTALSAIVSLSLMWYGITWWGAAAALIGQITGELVNLTGVVCILVAAHLRLKKSHDP